MNPPTFYASKVEQELLEVIDKLYKMFYAMGLNTGEKVELENTNSMVMPKLVISNEGTIGH